jgi:hypothetical protein
MVCPKLIACERRVHMNAVWASIDILRDITQDGMSVGKGLRLLKTVQAKISTTVKIPVLRGSRQSGSNR